MKNLFVWNTFMQWKPVAIKEQKVTENQARSDGTTNDKNQAPAETQTPAPVEQGVSYEERWRLVQYFSDWIKNADVRIQMLLAVQGFIVAAYGALIPATEKVGNFWNSWTYIWTAFFVSTVIISFKIGFYQRPNMSVSGRAGNIFSTVLIMLMRRSWIAYRTLTRWNTSMIRCPLWPVLLIKNLKMFKGFRVLCL